MHRTSVSSSPLHRFSSSRTRLSRIAPSRIYKHHLQSHQYMADRSVHYEAAFEEFLRLRGIPYVAVDEAKKALFANAKLKSFDFVVYSKTGPNLLIDVKGRQQRSSNGSPARRTFESWTTERDVEDLRQWEQVFGEGFKAIL